MEEEIKQLYIEKDLPYREVCKILNISKGKFERICKKYNIIKSKEYRKKLKSIMNKEELEELYINQNLTSEQIAKLPIAKGYSPNKILELIHLYNIEKSIEGNHYRQLAILDNTSQYEIEIQQLLKSWGIKSYKDKTVIAPQEIDLYCPDFKIGIEFNGNHYHSVNNKGKGYHQKKSLLAKEKGVFIYHIFEYEWLTRQEQMVNQLRNLFSLNGYKIFARKCIIREVPPKESRLFLEKNHLQGADLSSVRLGLYHNNELVSLMTFCKPRFNKKYEWELSRFCSRANTSVVGGGSKLFKHFIKKYKPNNILSYSNMAHTKGGIYPLLGFKYLSTSNPNYVWIKKDRYFTRYQCQRHKLIDKYPEFDGLSETEIMTLLGYEKLEDCGNITWLYEAVV